MLALEVLRQLDLGNSVAEFDEALEAYFIETDAFRRLVRGEIDVIAGDKGTGKTALFRILHRRYPSLPELNDIEVLPAFNVTGAPVFQRLNEGDPLAEGQYITLWKAYLLALAGNWILTLYEEAWTDSMFELEELLQKTGLRSDDDSAATVFSSIVNLFRRLLNPKSIEATVAVGPNGLPIVTGKLDLSEQDKERPYVPHDEALGLLDKVLGEIGLSLWLVFDRLDEAFAGTPAAEVPALRALLRTYLDLQEFGRIKLKLFLRKDLFRRITAGGFVNLTHVNARKMEIIWDEESLYDLLFRRVRENPKFLEAVAADAEEPDRLFAALFPDQVDAGQRKPRTWTWMMSRIRDGNDIRPPRNLIDLVQKSREAAIRREERERGEFSPGSYVIHPEALKAGLRALSKQRVEDTLLAEAGDRAELVERFRNSKAEHNEASLKEQLKVESDDEFRDCLQFLRDIGFLGVVGNNFKVPMLYRDGLGITQGKAFAVDGSNEGLGVDEDEEEDE